MVSISKIEELFKQNAPEVYEAFKAWVGDKWILLLEIIGYTMYPRYDFHKAILLVGYEPAWSMYMRLLKDILGPDNVVSVSFQDLANSNSDAAALLYRKLANIYPGMPDRPRISEKRFRELLGEDLLCARRKYRGEICFYNYAKLIFGSEKMPEPVGDPNAFWKRWIVVEFRQPPNDPGLYEKIPTKETIEKTVAISIGTFMGALHRGAFPVLV